MSYPNDAVVRAWARLVRAQHAALAAIEQALRKAKLPPLAWYDALLELERAGGSLRPFELEREMLLAQHNVSRLIDRLEMAGYVERRAFAADRRGQVIAITKPARPCGAKCGRSTDPRSRQHSATICRRNRSIRSARCWVC